MLACLTQVLKPEWYGVEDEDELEDCVDEDLRAMLDISLIQKAGEIYRVVPMVRDYAK